MLLDFHTSLPIVWEPMLPSWRHGSLVPTGVDGAIGVMFSRLGKVYNIFAFIRPVFGCDHLLVGIKLRKWLISSPLKVLTLLIRTIGHKSILKSRWLHISVLSRGLILRRDHPSRYLASILPRVGRSSTCVLIKGHISCQILIIFQV